MKSQNLLQEIFQNSGALVLTTDENFNIRFSSSGVQSIFGQDPISLAGKNVFEFVPSENREQWRACLENAGNSKRTEIHLVSATGKDLYFDVAVSNHIEHHEIRGMVIFLHDVTEQKLQQIQLEKENEHLDQFIYKTTHDLRSPIHSVMGVLDLIEKANEKERAGYLKLARQSLLRLESVIDEVNNFYRVDKMAMVIEKIDLNALLEDEISLLKNHPKIQNISIGFTCRGDVPLYSDLIRLKTIIGNLLSNGVKYSDSEKRNPFIRIATTVEERELIITITDNGIGIAREHIGRIFDIFFRATHQASGTGLGLHIVKDTIERLNGKVAVQSQLGVGTQFKIYLPNMLFSQDAHVLSLDGKNAMH